MNIQKVYIWPLFTLIGVVGQLCYPPAHALAAASPSYQLYDSQLNYGERGTEASQTYQLNENGVTWIQQPVTGTHFKIVSGFTPSIVSSSSSSISSMSSALSILSSSSIITVAPPTEQPGGHRGNRGPSPMPPSYHPAATQSSSSFSSSFSSSYSSQSNDIDSGILLVSSSSISRISHIVSPQHGAAYPSGRCLVPAHVSSVYGACLLPEMWSLFGLLCAILESVLLIIILGREKRRHARHSQKHV